MSIHDETNPRLTPVADGAAAEVKGSDILKSAVIAAVVIGPSDEVIKALTLMIVDLMWGADPVDAKAERCAEIEAEILRRVEHHQVDKFVRSILSSLFGEPKPQSGE